MRMIVITTGTHDLPRSWSMRGCAFSGGSLGVVGGTVAPVTQHNAVPRLRFNKLVDPIGTPMPITPPVCASAPEP